MKLTDGKAVNVTIPSGKSCVKDQPVYFDGFHGIAMENGEAGDVIALEIAPHVHSFAVEAGATLAKGDIVYITTDGDNTVDDTNTNRAFGKVVVAKDANNIVEARTLENR